MILFLSEQVVCALHEDQINLYGGLHGVCDAYTLDAALNMPKAQFGGEFLHPSIFHMAAVYAFHISEGQPFFDGNKRTAGMAMLAFLQINGFEPIVPCMDYYHVVMLVANRRMGKEGLAEWLRKSTVSY